MNKSTHAFWLLTLAIILLCFISAFSPPSIDVVSSTKVDNKLKPLRITTGRTDAEFEILLGQTKYYQVVTNRNRLVIVESIKPELQGGASDVIFEVVKESRDTLGVYYDNKDEQGNALPSGMTRLIGRYWDGAEHYKVRLIAKRKGLSLFAENGYTLYQLAEVRESYEDASIVIDVKSPYSLGTTNNTVFDCFGNSISLDDTIIKYAGEYGIPPQYIKGQIEQESNFKNVWRYEPFFDIAIQSDDEKLDAFKFQPNGSLKPFWISSSGMGGAFPNHNASYVSPTDYEKTTQKIYGFMEDHLERYVDRTAVSVIYKNELANALTKKLKEYHKYSLDLGLKDTKKNKDAANFAIEILKNDFHWKDCDDTYEKYAQTRKATSYGYLQMMYTTALEKMFKETDSKYAASGTTFMDQLNATLPPEKLNEYNYLFPRYVDLMLQRLRLTLNKTAVIPDHDWTGGFEAVWKKAIDKHNPGRKTYGSEVLTKANHYLPSNN